MGISEIGKRRRARSALRRRWVSIDRGRANALAASGSDFSREFGSAVVARLCRSQALSAESGNAVGASGMQGEPLDDAVEPFVHAAQLRAEAVERVRIAHIGGREILVACV